MTQFVVRALARRMLTIAAWIRADARGADEELPRRGKAAPTSIDSVTAVTPRRPGLGALPDPGRRGDGTHLKVNGHWRRFAPAWRDFPRLVGAEIALLLVSLPLTGCKLKPEHNMEEQPSAHPAYKPSEAFPDGTTARPVPYGTVPRAPADSPGFAYADVRDLLPAMTGSAAETDVVPFPITREVLLRGQERFRIYCSVCHGRLGDGNGMIPQRGLTPPPSFHIDRLRQVSDGHIYNVISNGYGQMFSYNDRVGPEDRWMIVAYVRALQAGTSQHNQSAKLSDEDRRSLQGSRP